MGMTQKTCGECLHWIRVDKYRWGDCVAPLPAWLCHEEGPKVPIIYPDDPQAEECDLFVSG